MNLPRDGRGLVPRNSNANINAKLGPAYNRLHYVIAVNNNLKYQK